VRAVRSIAQRGVMVVGTAHGSSLGELLRNPELVPLVGGVTAVTLGDEAARRDNAGSKTRLERAGAPAFSSLLEVLARGRWAGRAARLGSALLIGRRAAATLAGAAH
jgi:stage III sporulation protein SpoIIIAA